MTLSWTPQRSKNGKIYCSPACGGDCTYAEFKKVTKRAKALAKIVGPKWKPHVWENLGWHFRATFGSSSVTEFDPFNPKRKKLYWADVNIGKQFQSKDRNPRKAVARAFAQADFFLDIQLRQWAGFIEANRNLIFGKEVK